MKYKYSNELTCAIMAILSALLCSSCFPTATPVAPVLATVSLAATPDTGCAPLTVTYSTVTNGFITSYDWDMNGNGSYSDNGIDILNGGPTQAATYTAAGTYSINVKVTDSLNTVATAAFSVTVSAWMTETLDGATSSVGDLGYSAALLANGSPAICYPHLDDQKLYFAHSNDTNGDMSTDWSKVEVDNAPPAALPCLALIDGKPAVSFTSPTWSGTLKYAYSSSPTGAAGTWTICDVTSLPLTLGASSLASVNGFPGISYVDASNSAAGTLKYAYSGTLTPTQLGDWIIVPVDPGPSPSTYGSSLAVVGGVPCISFDNFDGELLFARNPSPTGTTQPWVKVVLATTNISQGIGNAWESTLVQLQNGRPAISCFQHSSKDLLYCYSTAVDGAAGSWTFVDIDTAGEVGIRSKLALVGGLPGISYCDYDTGNLKYASSSQPNGSSGWTICTVDQAAFNTATATALIGLGPSTDAYNLKPAIAYWDHIADDLKYAINQ